jgi:hypothetical protein
VNNVVRSVTILTIAAAFNTLTAAVFVRFPTIPHLQTAGGICAAFKLPMLLVATKFPDEDIHGLKFPTVFTTVSGAYYSLRPEPL